MKKTILIILLIAQGLVMASGSYASWLYYHKPECKGKVIDAETKKPIEGAVVAVYYMTNTYNLAGGSNRVIHTKETLTDKNGEFVIPSYTTIISPFTTSHHMECIIYKPGYASYPTWVPEGNKSPEAFFSIEKSGSTGETYSFGKMVPFTYGVVELPRLKTKKERLMTMPSRPLQCDSEELPLLFKLINEERKRFGMGELR